MAPNSDPSHDDLKDIYFQINGEKYVRKCLNFQIIENL